MHVLRSQPYRPAAPTPGTAVLTWNAPDGGSASRTDMSFERHHTGHGKSGPGQSERTAMRLRRR